VDAHYGHPESEHWRWKMKRKTEEKQASPKKRGRPKKNAKK
jgi:hypothetical protein